MTLSIGLVGMGEPGGLPSMGSHITMKTTEREIKETIPFTIATKIIKYLGIYLPKDKLEGK